MTNVYFKKENDIILNGTLWEEVENKFMPFALPANHQKHSVPRRPVGVSSGVAPPPGGWWACPRVLLSCSAQGACQRVIYCRKCIHLLYNEK